MAFSVKQLHKSSVMVIVFKWGYPLISKFFGFLFFGGLVLHCEPTGRAVGAYCSAIKSP